ncbi:MAG: hypothetical protein AAFZ04_07185, partial [Pseudomonadota bacterium]
MYTIAALYHFTKVPDPSALRGPLLSLCEAEHISGTLILALEGINGTIAGPDAGIRKVLDHIRALPGFDGLVWKESHSTDQP